MKQITEEFQIYADGIAPVTTSTFTKGSEFRSTAGQFYGQGLMVVLNSKDEMSGMDATYHIINNRKLCEVFVPRFLERGNL